MTVDFVLYPLDTIKTRMQTRPGAEGLPPGSAIARSLRSGAFYRGERGRRGGLAVAPAAAPATDSLA